MGISWDQQYVAAVTLHQLSPQLPLTIPEVHWKCRPLFHSCLQLPRNGWHVPGSGWQYESGLAHDPGSCHFEMVGTNAGRLNWMHRGGWLSKRCALCKIHEFCHSGTSAGSIKQVSFLVALRHVGGRTCLALAVRRAKAS